jgi:hypothetical protein
MERENIKEVDGMMLSALVSDGCSRFSTGKRE